MKYIIEYRPKRSFVFRRGTETGWVQFKVCMTEKYCLEKLKEAKKSYEHMEFRIKP